MDADAAEIRVLGCLIEKQRTTPDAYPLSLNSLRLACNQATNREPVVEYEEETIRIAIGRLSQRGWVRLASGRGSRAVKYRHLLDEAIGVSRAELSLMCVLMLRGPQTLGELKQRSERLHSFGPLDEVGEALENLAGRELVERLSRRPGQKEERYRQLLGEEAAAEDTTVRHTAGDRIGELEERVARLEGELATLRLSLRNPSFERGGESIPDRPELDAVEDVLEEATHD